MSGILKVDQIQLRDGSSPSAADLGITNSINSADLPSGSSVQTVHYNNDTDITFTSASWVDSGVAFNITPKFNDSSILVNFNIPIMLFNSAGPNQGGGIRIYRTINGVESLVYDTPGDINGPLGAWLNLGTLTGYSDIFLNFPISLVDEPSTISSVEYRLKVYIRDGGIRFNYTQSVYTPKIVAFAQEIAQ